MTDPEETPALAEVRDAVDRMDQGEASLEVMSVLVRAARAYAAMTPEYGFVAPQPGLVYASRNELLIETMHAARPVEQLFTRLSPPWVPTDRVAR